MGDCADDMIEGFACERCRMFFADGEEPGYPRRCTACGGEYETL